MRGFEMCEACAEEYGDPRDRRFHAQPNACHACGPSVTFVREGIEFATATDALRLGAEVILDGGILAVKGLGGYHLCVDATNGDSIARLRRRKHREGKPLALMVPSMETAEELCEVDDIGREALLSSAAPIVLLPVRAGQSLVAAGLIAPRMQELGLMMPYTPLHHVLVRKVGRPMIVTSGNLSDEPICIDNAEAEARLGSIADAFLHNDRPIERAVEDSVVRVIAGGLCKIRRSRGYAPRPIQASSQGGLVNADEIILAVGAHQKNTVALGVGKDVFASQHLGDLDTAVARSAFEKAVGDLPHLYDAKPSVVVRDLHPDYASSRWVESRSDRDSQAGTRILGVQHHLAHAYACLSENQIEGPALAVVWDGTGFGTDGTIWGGETFFVSDEKVARIGHLRPFRLPGGEAAVREPARSAVGAVFECGLPELDSQVVGEKWRHWMSMLDREINCPVTTSAGRLFDAVASLIGLRDESTFEGQAAMELEHLAQSAVAGESPEWTAAFEPYPFEILEQARLHLDWRLMVTQIIEDAEGQVDRSQIAYRFHLTLAEMIAESLDQSGIAAIRGVSGIPVALSGGCFQNKLLTELTVNALTGRSYAPVVHRKLPPGDGGISYGQVAAVRSSSAAAARAEGLIVENPN